MAAWRYGISPLVLKKYFTHSLCSLVKYFSTLKGKFCISTRPCNILYFYSNDSIKNIFAATIETIWNNNQSRNFKSICDESGSLVFMC